MQQHNKRGDFSKVADGVSYGGGQKASESVASVFGADGSLQQPTRFAADMKSKANRKVMREFFAEPDVRRVMKFLECAQLASPRL